MAVLWRLWPGGLRAPAALLFTLMELISLPARRVSGHLELVFGEFNCLPMNDVEGEKRSICHGAVDFLREPSVKITAAFSESGASAEEGFLMSAFGGHDPKPGDLGDFEFDGMKW